MEVEAGPVSEEELSSFRGDAGRRLRRGSLFCSGTATRTGGESDRNHKRDRNHPVPIPERAARYVHRLQLPARSADCCLVAPMLGYWGQLSGVRDYMRA